MTAGLCDYDGHRPPLQLRFDFVREFWPFFGAIMLIVAAIVQFFRMVVIHD